MLFMVFFDCLVKLFLFDQAQLLLLYFGVFFNPEDPVL